MSQHDRGTSLIVIKEGSPCINREEQPGLIRSSSCFNSYPIMADEVVEVINLDVLRDDPP